MFPAVQALKRYKPVRPKGKLAHPCEPGGFDGELPAFARWL
jgi:hypothetical protein